MSIFTTADKINIGLLLTTAFGVFAAFRQVYILNKQKRADLILQLYNTFYKDQGMQEIYYKIEYNLFEYDVDSFPFSNDERNLDNLLGLFSNICQLYKMKIIKAKDLEFIKYEFQVIYENIQVENYFKTLDYWFKIRQINHLKFPPFRDVGQMISDKEI